MSAACPPVPGVLPQHPPVPTHRYEVCFLNASPLSFSSRLSCSMSATLPASSESPPSAPSEARRPLEPPVAGLVRSVAWGSMLVAVSLSQAPALDPLPAPACEWMQLPVSDGGAVIRRLSGEVRGSKTFCDSCRGQVRNPRSRLDDGQNCAQEPLTNYRRATSSDRRSPGSGVTRLSK